MSLQGDHWIISAARATIQPAMNLDILAKVVSAAEHSSLYQAAHIACWFASPNTQVILNFPTALSLSLSEHAVVLLSHYKMRAVTRCALHFHP